MFAWIRDKEVARQDIVYRKAQANGGHNGGLGSRGFGLGRSGHMNLELW
jgi:hypothetical protein